MYIWPVMPIMSHFIDLFSADATPLVPKIIILSVKGTENDLVMTWESAEVMVRRERGGETRKLSKIIIFSYWRRRELYLLYFRLSRIYIPAKWASKEGGAEGAAKKEVRVAFYWQPKVVCRAWINNRAKKMRVNVRAYVIFFFFSEGNIWSVMTMHDKAQY